MRSGNEEEESSQVGRRKRRPTQKGEYPMPTLVIHAPAWAARALGRRNFATVLRTGTGRNFAIANNLRLRIAAGCKVVVLDKNTRQRAEGVLALLTPTAKTASGIQRYDVVMNHLAPVVYKPEKLNRCGVAVI